MWIKIKKNYVGVEGTFVKDETRHVDEEQLARLKKLGKKLFQYQETVAPHERLTDHDAKARDAAQQEFRRLQGLSIEARDKAATCQNQVDELGKDLPKYREVRDKLATEIAGLQVKIDSGKANLETKAKMTLEIRSKNRTLIKIERAFASHNVARYESDLANMDATDAKIAADDAAKVFAELDPNFNPEPTEVNNDESIETKPADDTANIDDNPDTSTTGGSPAVEDGDNSGGQTTSPGS